MRHGSCSTSCSRRSTTCTARTSRTATSSSRTSSSTRPRAISSSSTSASAWKTPSTTRPPSSAARRPTCLPKRCSRSTWTSSRPMSGRWVSSSSRPSRGSSPSAVRVAHAAKTEAELNKKILKADFAFPSTVTLSSTLKKLLRKILNPAADKRPTTAGILADEWFLGEAAERE